MFGESEGGAKLFAKTPPALIIVNWNSGANSTELLISLKDVPTASVFVVDNCSTDCGGQREMILDAAPHAFYIQREINGGYAAGVNTGVRHAMAEGFSRGIVLNPDARPGYAAIAAIDGALSRSDIVGIQQSSEPTLEHSYPTSGTRRGMVFKTFECPGCDAGEHAVDLVAGAVIGFHFSVWRTLGGFDEDYFHYDEEIDFCYRAGRIGSRLIWLCRPTVFHKRGESLPIESAGATYYRARNEVLYFVKNSTLPFVGRAHPRLLAGELRHAERAWRGQHMRAFLNGVKDGLCGVTGIKEDLSS